MKWFKKVMLFAGIAVCAIGSMPVKAQAKQVGTIYGHPIFDNEFGGVEITDGGSDASVTQRGASYVATYDPRVNGMVSKVEDQGITNTCWAFATIAAIESNLIKKGYENSSVNLSENHLAYFYYNRQPDALGYTMGDQNLISKMVHWSDNGGTLQGTALALTTWAGVVKDTSLNSENDATGAFQYIDNLDSSLCYNSDYVVKNVYMYDYSVDTVKQAIVDHGAVACGIYIDPYYEYFSLDTEAYYYTKSGGNHAVTIVGWDDTYSRTNFDGAAMPSKDGAWIIKNSWGTSVHDGGYVYVSYEDASLCELVAFDMEKSTEKSDHNYQHDGTANPVYSLSADSGTSFANVFQVKGSASGYNEILEAVSAYVLTTNVNYSVQIYTGLTSSTNPTKGKAMLSVPQRGTFVNAGYNRIELNTPVTLTAGEKYAVVITLSTANGSRAKLGVESDYSDSNFTFFTGVDEARGFVKLNGNWYDYGDPYSVGYNNVCNLRIKAYTRNTNQKTTYKLSNSSISLSKGSSTTLKLNINPTSVKRNITWTSSNKKVATVSSSGKVKGKAYGTATIKAKFVAGKSTKTLSCKVTVGPSKVQSFKVKGAKKKITVTWKKNKAATGYVIYYSKKKDSGYKTLTTIKSNTKTKYSKKMKKGTYYVKMRPYLTKSGKKLYGSYTAVKTVKVK